MTKIQGTRAPVPGPTGAAEPGTSEVRDPGRGAEGGTMRKTLIDDSRMTRGSERVKRRERKAPGGTEMHSWLTL